VQTDIPLLSRTPGVSQSPLDQYVQSFPPFPHPNWQALMIEPALIVAQRLSQQMLRPIRDV
jgi:hypothetical protein